MVITNDVLLTEAVAEDVRLRCEEVACSGTTRDDKGAMGMGVEVGDSWVIMGGFESDG